MSVICHVWTSHPELKALHPLSHRLVFWGGGVSQLDLEQVIASWSIAVPVEHNGGAGAACTHNNTEKMQQNDHQKYRELLDARRKQELL